MKRSIPFASMLLATFLIQPGVASLQAQPEPDLPRIVLKPYADGFTDITDLASTSDARLFVVEQGGLVKIIDGDGSVLPTPFLDISHLITAQGNEQGLLGLVFHPNYAVNGYFYVNYTAADPEGETHIARFSVSADPNVADASSEMIILTQPQPFGNHNAGDLNFGPDGYLYIPLGDGGSAFDPQENAQDPTTWLGKMLRVDVDGGSPYAIPASNPFVGDPAALDEIWAMGLRNPWRFSFDRETGDMWIGDVGQNIWEEVDVEPAGSMGGTNWGWDCYEGNMLLEPEGCGPASDYTFPVFTYNNPTDGCAVTGGYVYRGDDYPVMQGHYIFTDFCSGNFWTLYPDGSGGYAVTEQLQFNPFDYTTFGEDHEGELYVAGRGGTVCRVIDASCQNNKIMICHKQGNKNKTLCIAFDEDAIAAHLAHGDELGPCEDSNMTSRSLFAGSEDHMTFAIHPNPVLDGAIFTLSLPVDDEVTLEVLDASGRLVTMIYQGEVAANAPLRAEFESNALKPGAYIALLTTSTASYHQKFMVVRH